MLEKLKYAAAGAFMMVASATSSHAEEKQKIEYVDVHAVLEMDLSGSMEPDEKCVMLKGYALGLTSKEAQSDFDSGLTYAISLIYFGGKARHVVTEVIHNSAQAKEFADTYLWDFANDAPRPIPTGLNEGNTSSGEALLLAKQLFDHESDYGIQSSNKSVLIAGDDDGEAFAVVQARSLATDYNATVYGMPIVLEANNLRKISFFTDMTTPTGMKYVNKDGREKGVKPGIFAPASSPAHMVPVINAALNLNLF